MTQQFPKLLIATRNKGKLKELSSLLQGVPYTLVSLDDVGIDEDVEETGTTFEENATLKAETYSRLSGLPALSDDSGLEVDPLNGEPGIYSARYAGEGATDEQRIAFLHAQLKLANAPEQSWSARFRCVIAIAWPSGETNTFDGRCEGRIINESRGSNGFGYDPVFLFSDSGKTMAELSSEEKNDISHRSMAVRSASQWLIQRSQ